MFPVQLGLGLTLEVFLTLGPPDGLCVKIPFLAALP